MLAKLNIQSLLLDGEVLVLDEGRSHFEVLDHRQRREKDHFIYYVFRPSLSDGRDLGPFPLRHKAILKDLIERTFSSGIQFRITSQNREGTLLCSLQERLGRHCWKGFQSLCLRKVNRLSVEIQELED
jgi:ATP-dependent DNA ligase